MPAERPEEHQDEESEIPTYCKIVKYEQERLSIRAYTMIQGLLHSRKEVHLACFRFQFMTTVEHVAVLGEQPTKWVDGRIQMHLKLGEPTTLPDHIMNMLIERYNESKSGWVEEHYRPGRRFTTNEP